MREITTLQDDYIVDDESYFADQMYVTNSMLKKLLTGGTKNLEHYLNTEQKETEAFLIGSAFHCYILEPEEFDSRYVFAPKFDRRTKVGKAGYAEFESTIGSKKAVPEYYQGVFESLEENLSRHAEANRLLQGAKKREAIHFWEDKATGIKCKGKVDAEGEDYIVDLKSTSKRADIESFNNFLNDYTITQQAAFYLNGTKKKNFYFIMCELKAPFNIAIYKMSDQAIEHGEKKVEYCLELYKKIINEDYSSDLNGGEIVVI